MTNTKTRSRRKFAAEFKAKVAMEALQEKRTLSELSKKYEVHPNLITKWKNQLKEQSTSVFKERGEAADDAKDKLIEQLYKTIGSLTMDMEFLKKAVAMSKEERKSMVSKEEKLSIRQQCVLLGLCRTSMYYTPSEETEENLEVMSLLDRQYAITPFYGQRRLQAWLAEKGHPEIVNSDQGCQFTSTDYVELLKDNGIAISMDSRGRALDDIFIERLWRSVKQEYVYLNPCKTGDELWRGLDRYFRFYNDERLHQSLGYKTPASCYLHREKAA